jgi:hypothetical protein
VPQVNVPPQPSLMVPQLAPSSSQVLGTQARQRLSMQLSPARQLPHSTRCPVQLLVIPPQLAFWLRHSAGGRGGTHSF